MNISHITLSALVILQMLSLNAYAANKQDNTGKIDSLEIIIKSYTDSIHKLSLTLDSLNDIKNITADNNGKYYRLFVPATFYHSAAKKQLSLARDTHGNDKVADAVDMAMLNVYLTRPDLIVNNETQLKKSGTIRNDLQLPVTQDIKLTPEDTPIPETPVVVPTTIVVKKPNFWKFTGEGDLQFMQNYISENWHKGGESNYSMLTDIVLTANYNNKSRIKFENKLEMKLGFQTSRDDTLHKFKATNDLLRYTGKLGLQASKQWYYTFQVLAYTQFTQGLKSNDKRVYSDFMSPFNLNLGLGMDYSVDALNGRLKGSINISALSFNFKYVDRKNLAKKHGVIGDHHTVESFGSQLTADLSWKITDIVSWKTRLYGYTTYEKVLLEWENTINLRVSKYISANIFLHPRFDDSTSYDEDFGYWQFKEYSSLGLSYSF